MGAFALWGVLPVYWKALDAIDPRTVLAHRAWWTLVLVMVLVAATRRGGRLLGVVRRPALVGRLVLTGLLLGANWYLFIWAVNHNYLLQASLGYYINPLMSVLLGRVVLGERLRRAQIVAVFTAAAGVMVMVFGGGGLLWISLSLGATFAAYGLIRKTTDVDLLSGLSVEMIVLTAVGVVVTTGAGGGRSVFDFDAPTWLLLIGAGPVTAAPLLLFAYGVQRIRLSTVGFCQYVAPSCMLILGVLVYHQEFTNRHAATFGLIWTALAIYSYDSFRSSRR